MNVETLKKPEHGAQRNWRIESSTPTMGEFNLANGENISVPVHSEEHSVSERYCANCDKWVTAKGIFGGVWCPECDTEWMKKS